MNKIGALITLKRDKDIREEMKKLRDIGCECCQITSWDMSLYSDEYADEVKAAADEYGIEISTVWAGWSGPAKWNFIDGPSTLGIVPDAYRMKRSEELIVGAKFAARIGCTRVATHAGFLPENMNDPKYRDVVAALRYIADEFGKLGINLLFETGQETPITLLRVIEDIGLSNVGINMDTANLILYGKGNSADAITVFGKYVMDTHIKDGLYPTDGMALGKQVQVGEGRANIPAVVKKLSELGYTGPMTIEREISGEQQAKDIAATRDMLKEIFETLE